MADQEPQQAARSQGDHLFRGVLMKEVAALPSGYVAAAVNMRFVDGRPGSRKGARPLGWTTHDVASLDAVLPLGTVHGHAVWADPQTNIEWIIVAAGGVTWKMRQGQAATRVNLPSNITLSGRVRFTSCLNVLMMHRGVGIQTLVMTDINAGFGLPGMTTSGDYTEPIPDGSMGLFFQNRVWIPNENDLLSFSDVLEYTRYMPALQAYWIEKGSGDGITGIFKFNEASILVLKNRSVHALLNLVPATSGDIPYPSAYHDDVTREYGSSSPDAIVAVGKRCWFLADQRGVVAVKQTETNQLQCEELPESDGIQDLVNRIDWDWAHKAQAAFWGNRVYFAVSSGATRQLGDDLIPSGTYASATLSVDTVYGADYFWEKGDSEQSLTNGTEILYTSGWFQAQGSSVTLAVTSGENPTATLQRHLRGFNDLVFVYDTKNQAWCGHDEGAAVAVEQWVKFHYGSQLRLGFLSPDGFLYLYEDGYADGVVDADGVVNWTVVPAQWTSRGYWGDSEGVKRFREGTIELATWDASLQVETKVDGIAESALATTITKDRTKYYSYFASDYDPTNAGNNFLAPQRQDYSISIADGATLLVGDGLDAGRQQEMPESFWIHQRGRYCQLVLTALRGRFEVKSAAITALPGRSRKGSVS